MSREREKFPPGILLLLLGLSLSAAIVIRAASTRDSSHEVPVSEHRHTVPALGTFATVVVVADDSLAPQIFMATDSLLAFMDGQLGMEGDGSLRELNTTGCGNMDVTSGSWSLHPSLVHMILLSDTLCSLTGGAFDPSIGALTVLWGWPSDPVLPDSADVDSVLALTGWDRIVFEGDSVFLPYGMLLDFGAVAKGYTVDRVYELAMAMGASGALVEVGGEVRCGSTPELDRTWRIAVRHPRSGGFWDTIELEEGAVATSGDYESFFLEDGVRYSHLLDPSTGWPSRRAASATVTAGRCDVADALATAVAVGGEATAGMIPDSLYGFILVLAPDESGVIREWTTGELQ